MGAIARKLAVIFGVLTACIGISWLCISVLGPRNKKTNLRAIGAIERLPVAPSPETAQQFMFDYSSWGNALHVTGAENCKRVSFHAEVKVLEAGSEISKVSVNHPGGEDVIGWVPSDWLENYDGQVKERENPATKRVREEAKTFVGLTESQLRARLGPPIKTERHRDAIEGGYSEFVYDDNRDTQTFFDIYDREGVVSDGQYKGFQITLKYFPTAPNYLPHD